MITFRGESAEWLERSAEAAGVTVEEFFNRVMRKFMELPPEELRQIIERHHNRKIRGLL